MKGASVLNAWRKTPDGALSTPDMVGFSLDAVGEGIRVFESKSKAYTEDITYAATGNRALAQDLGSIGPDIATFLGTGGMGTGARIGIRDGETVISATSKTIGIKAPKPSVSAKKPIVKTKEYGTIKKNNKGKIKSVSGTQKHHVIHQALQKHDLFELSGMHVNDPKNIMLLLRKRFNFLPHFNPYNFQTFFFHNDI